MNSSRIRIFSLWAALSVGVTASAELGEFTISDELIRQIQVVSTQNKPFQKNGRQVTPSIDVQLGANLTNNPNEVGFNLTVDLRGTSKSSGFTPVMGRKGVTSVTQADVEAHFEQELQFDGSKLKSGEFSGKSKITPKGVSVSNNFGVLNRAVNRRAQKEAPGQVQAELPKERRDLEESVRQQVQKGIEQAKDFVSNTTSEAQQIFSQAKSMPFAQKWSSEQTGPQGGVTLRLFEEDGNSQRAGKPVFSNSDQIASSGVFHQDLLTKILTPQLAGKEMKITELRTVLCSDQITSLINFCEKDIPVGSLGLSVIFDEEKPIEFVFEDGKVTIKINAKNRVGVKLGGAALATPSWLAPAKKPDSGEVDLEPYQVEVVYSIEKGRASLKNLKVSSNTPAPQEDLPNRRNAQDVHSGSQVFDQMWKRMSASGRGLLNSVQSKALEDEYRKIMKDEIEFPTVSFSTKLKIDPANLKAKPEIVEAGTLIPLEVKSENGWLAVSAAFCVETTRPLGLSFDKKNRVSFVQPGSPAALAGFKEGDQISAYAGAEDRKKAIGMDIEPFIEFIKESAIAKNSYQRTVQLSGISADGVRFDRSVSLCPSQLEHRKNAEALLNNTIK